MIKYKFGEFDSAEEINQTAEGDERVKGEYMKGYKVFHPDWTCKGFKYEVGKKYHCDGEISCCENGFHFCTKLADCFNYYEFNSNNKVAEIEASGDIDSEEDDTKHCASDIEIIREITWHEVLDMINEGKDNTGMRNTGDHNTGSCNTGDCNTGTCNTGYWNTGYNTGYANTGDRNTGDYNTGDCNTGDFNTGYGNTGDCNTGDRNTGNHNTGNCNTGDFNTGDWNKTNNNTGCFMTEERTIEMFNKPSGMTYGDWERSTARNILLYMPQNIVNIVWTDAEKICLMQRKKRILNLKRLADIYTKKKLKQMYRAGGMDFHQMIRKP